MVFAMVKWFRRHAAVRWGGILLLLAATSFGQPIDEAPQGITEELFVTEYPEITTEYPETTTGYSETTTGYPEITTEYPGITNASVLKTSPEDANSSDIQRSERMVTVYVKPDFKTETRNISDFLDYGDVIVKTEGEDTIVIATNEDEYEESGDGDIMTMAGRSLRRNSTEDQLAAEAAAFESAKQPLLEDNELKNVLHKWNSEFNLTDLYKINLASVFAKDYDEMSKLIDENLVEDTDQFARSKGMAEGFEPRVVEGRQADLDLAVEATEEVMSPPVLPPPSSTPQPNIAPPVRPSPIRRPSYFSPPNSVSTLGRPGLKSRPGAYQTVTGKPMVIHSVGPSKRLPGQRQPMPLAAPRIRPPQSTTTPPSGRFGERLANRLPRPFQRILNMTVSRQTTTESPEVLPYSSIAHLPAPSMNHPARVPAPYYLRISNQKGTSTDAGKRLPIATTTARPRVTTEASKKPFGARIRPPRIEVRNSTNGIQKVKEETKEQRDIKISQLRSNLVGKLVVIQSVLDKKEKMSQSAKSRTPAVSFSQLPSGLLKPIIPLRPRTPVATTVATVTTTDEAEATTTESTIAWKPDKKYRRPPSFRKENQKIPSKNVKEVVTTTESVEATTSGAPNATETPVYSEVSSSQPPYDFSTVTMNDNGETTHATAPSVEMVTTTVNATETTLSLIDHKVPTTPSPYVTVPSVETSPANTTATAVRSSTETTIEDRETRTPQVTASSVETSTNTPETRVRSSTETSENSGASSTAASATSVESTPLILNTTEISKQRISDISTEAKIDYDDTLSTPRPVVAPQTVPTPVEIDATQKQPSDRQENPIVQDISSVGNATDALPHISSTVNIDVNAAPQSVSTVSKNNSVSTVESSTENRSTSTYAPEDDPYLKAMIARALQLSEEDDLDEIQGNFPEEDESLEEVPRDLTGETEEDEEYGDEVSGAKFSGLKEKVNKREEIPSEENERDLNSNPKENHGIEDGSLDLPGDVMDAVDDEDLVNNDSVLSRVDRSAESLSKVDIILNHKPTAVLKLARGAIQPITLPYNIISDNLDKAHEAVIRR